MALTETLTPLIDRTRAFFEGSGLRNVPGVNRVERWVLELSDGYVTARGHKFYPLFTGGRALYYTDEYEKEIVDHYLDLAQDANCIIDVGASIGLYTITGAGATSGDVYAFEPSTERVSVLRRNIDANGLENCHAERAAIGGENTDILVLSNTGATATAQRTIDSIDLEPDLIKIDADGMEYAILDGARETLSTNQPDIIIEVHPAIMRDLGRSKADFEQLVDEVAYSYTLLERDGEREFWHLKAD